jgi:meiotically up-regulated gene 157 (Mug157) protein
VAAVEKVISNFTARMVDPDLATLFSNCFPNTLDTTVSSYTPSTPTTAPAAFIITGDIDAQWFRDSSNQVLPYVRLAPQDPHLQDLICGLINRHAADVAHDPFANAFNFNASGAGHQSDQRKPPMTPQVFEGSAGRCFVSGWSFRQARNVLTAFSLFSLSAGNTSSIPSQLSSSWRRPITT